MTQATPPRVLVVDDYLNMRLMVKNMLRQIGVREVDFANDGSTALSMLRQRAYRLVISDWNMTPMTGMQLLEELAKYPRAGRPAFIMITGNRAVTEQALAQGADATVVKPFSTADLKQALALALAAG